MIVMEKYRCKGEKNVHIRYMKGKSSIDFAFLKKSGAYGFPPPCLMHIPTRINNINIQQF